MKALQSVSKDLLGCIRHIHWLPCLRKAAVGVQKPLEGCLREPTPQQVPARSAYADFSRKTGHLKTRHPPPAFNNAAEIASGHSLTCLIPNLFIFGRLSCPLTQTSEAITLGQGWEPKGLVSPRIRSMCWLRVEQGKLDPRFVALGPSFQLRLPRDMQ